MFNEVAQCKINIQKSIVFLYTNHKKSDSETKTCSWIGRLNNVKMAKVPNQFTELIQCLSKSLLASQWKLTS